MIVTCNVHPDLDGFASAVAYAEFLTKTGTPAVPAIFGQLNIETQFVLDICDIAAPPPLPAREPTGLVAVVDMSDQHGLSERVNPEQVIEVIDHRPEYDRNAYPRARYQIEPVGAAATLIAEKFHSRQVDSAKGSATLLASAIISNTLNFQGRITTHRDVTMFSWLNERVHLAPDFAHRMFSAKSQLQGEALGAAIEGDFKWFTFGCQRIGFGQLEIIGAEALLSERRVDIMRLLHHLRSAHQLAAVVLSIADLEGGCNVFFSTDPVGQRLFSAALGITFNDGIAKRPGLVLRKEIVPLLKSAIERQ